MSELLHVYSGNNTYNWVTPQCQAKSKRSGLQCGNYAIKGKRVCKFHGGLSTGPKTEEGRKRQHMSRWKHGMRSKEAIAERRYLRELIRQSNEML